MLDIPRQFKHIQRPYIIKDLDEKCVRLVLLELSPRALSRKPAIITCASDMSYL